MSSSQYRKRFFAFVAVSLLVHLAIIVYFLWNPIHVEKPKPEKTTVEIKLKKKVELEKKEVVESKKKPEEKHSDKKKAEQQKAEDKKKSDEEKEEPKKAEPKKEEPKKEEPKKETPKKDPLDERFSVDKVKDQKPKKAEPKKAKPKKVEPKKAEPKKAKPKKVEPKKVEPKKVEPKKAKPKKAEPKKAEPKKVEPKKVEPKTEATKDKPSKTPQPSDLAYWTKKLGNRNILTDREMKRTVIETAGLNKRFDSRVISGRRLINKLNRYERREFDEYYVAGGNKIYANYSAPEWDGKKYSGSIRFIVDTDGYISEINLKRSSGNTELDQAFLMAIKKTIQLDVPKDLNAARAFVEMPKVFEYDETDLIQ